MTVDAPRPFPPGVTEIPAQTLHAWQNCVKCGGQEFRNDKIRTTGDGLSRFMNLQNQKYHARSCCQCGFTEFWRAQASTAGNVLDLLLGA